MTYEDLSNALYQVDQSDRHVYDYVASWRHFISPKEGELLAAEYLVLEYRIRQLLTISSPELKTHAFLLFQGRNRAMDLDPIAYTLLAMNVRKTLPADFQAAVDTEETAVLAEVRA